MLQCGGVCYLLFVSRNMRPAAAWRQRRLLHDLFLSQIEMIDLLSLRRSGRIPLPFGGWYRRLFLTWLAIQALAP